MPDAFTCGGDLTVVGALNVVGQSNLLGTVVVPDGAITATKIASSAEIETNKLKHRYSKSYVQDPGSDIVSATKVIHLCRAAGALHSVKVRPATKPTGGDKQYTVDVKRAVNGSGTFATMLSSVITVSSGASTDHTQQSATLIGSPTTAAGDCLHVVITTSGSTGSQGQGVIVEVEIDESGIGS